MAVSKQDNTQLSKVTEEEIEQYIIDHPNRFFSEFNRTLPFRDVPVSVFNRIKKKVKESGIKPSKKSSNRSLVKRGLKHDGEAILAYIEKNPKSVYSEFVKNKEFKDVPRSTHRYYRDILKKKGKVSVPKRAYKRSTQKIYTSLWVGSAEDIGHEGINAITNFVEQLREQKIVPWEIVHISNPSSLEIRVPNK